MRAGATVFGLVVVAACGSRTDLDLVVVPQPLDPALVEACTKLVSCPATYEVGYTGVSQCLWLDVAADYGVGVGFPRFLLTAVTTDFFSYASVGCLASAPDCAAVARCVAGDTSFDCNATPGGGCVGDTWVRCRQGKPYAVDCASSPLSPGATCVEDTMGGYPVCGYGTCSGTAVTCDQGTLATCNDGVAQRMPCASLGQACTTTSGGGCIGTGADCNEAEARCDGNVYVECNGGHEQRYDCEQVAIPSTCVAEQSIGAFGFLSPLVPCIPTPRLACNPATYDDRCHGTRLVYCDGAERSIDCAAIGFRTCGSALGYPACTR